VKRKNGAFAQAWDWQAVRGPCLREARRLLPPAEAEDAVQEALVRAWKNGARCRDPSAPLPWILQITRNEARRIMARSQRRGEVGLEKVPDGNLSEDRGEEATDRAAVRAALADLTTEERTLLAMRYSADLTYASLAELLGLPEGTVKVRLHRLRSRLRGALESDE
jgi:RNA polymerase sigma-70 factor (ECF subfamily)